MRQTAGQTNVRSSRRTEKRANMENPDFPKVVLVLSLAEILVSRWHSLLTQQGRYSPYCNTASRKMFMLAFGYEYNPYASCSEKSRSAIRRERSAKDKFESVANQLERAKVTHMVRIIELGCKPESDSMFHHLPAVCVKQILDHVIKQPDDENVTAPAAVGAAAVANASAARHPKTGPEAEVDIDLASLYTPGKKHSFHLLDPSCHLTSPCWRDFSRHVRKNENWNVKRIAATPLEKKEHRETRKGKVYFIKAIYTVPSITKKKKKKQEDGDSKPPAKKKVKKA